MKMKDKNEQLSTLLFNYANEFEETLLLDRKDTKTIENYLNVINKFIEFITENNELEKLGLNEIDTRIIKKYFLWRDEKNLDINNRYLKNSTKMNDKKILMIFFNFIEEEFNEEIEFHIKWKKISFKKELKERHHYSEDIIKSILKNLDSKLKADRCEFNYMLNFCFKLALYGGLRATEICNIKIENFGNVYISKTTNTKLIPLQILGKGSTQYTNPIPYKYIKNELNYFKRKKTSGYIFYSKRGKKLNRILLYRYFENISNELSLGYKGIHIIRHTFASNLVELGIDIRNIQTLLRHSNISTTTIYTARSQSKMEEAVSKL